MHILRIGPIDSYRRISGCDCWHIYTLVRDPTSTSITFARQTELMFPVVTICSLNLLNVTTLRSASNNAITDTHSE